MENTIQSHTEPQLQSLFSKLKEIFPGEILIDDFQGELLVDELLSDRAHTWYDHDMDLRIGGLSSNANIAQNYKKSSEDKIVRGFALLDKTWRHHSWNCNTKTNRGIETTEPIRNIYFGVILSAGDAFLHCILNQAISDDAKETLSFIEKHTNEEKEELKHVLNTRLPQLIKANEENTERIKILQMDPQIFVGGLAPHTTDQTLALHFSPYGVIREAKVIYNRKTRLSKGYGFVTYANPQSALTAVMNPKPIIDGKICNCNVASLKPSITRNKKTTLEASTLDSGESLESASKRMKVTPTGSTGVMNTRNLQIKSYAAKLKELGADVSEETVTAHIEELKKMDPPKALHYFCEMSEVFRGKPTFDIYSYELLHMAHHYRQTGEIKEFEKPHTTNEETFPDYFSYQNQAVDFMHSHYTDPNYQPLQSIEREAKEGIVPSDQNY